MAKVQPTPEQMAASKAKREAQMAEAAARKEKIATTPKGGIWTGKPLSDTWRNHIHRGSVKNALISTGIAGAASGGVLLSQKQRKSDKIIKFERRRAAETGAGAVAGAATMDAVNTVGGQSAKAILKERRNRRGLSPREEANWADHKKKVLGTKAGQPVPNDDSVPQAKKAQLYRTAPKDSIPDRTANRLLAFKNTKGWTAGSLAGAALVGGKIAHDRGKVNKSAADDALEGMSRAARRAAKKGKVILSDEEIAARKAAAAAKGPRPQPQPKQEVKAAPKVNPRAKRSSFLGAGQVRDLAIGVPVGAGALYYGTRRPIEKRDTNHRWRNTALVAGAGAATAHAAEGGSLKLAEREIHRVNAANNADHRGRKPKNVTLESVENRQADRGIHSRRAISHLDDARYLRGAKTALGLGAAGAGYKAVKKDDDRTGKLVRTAAGAVGGAALLDAADTMTGASLKRIARVQRDRAYKGNPERKSRENKIINDHGKKHGFVNSEGKGRVPRPDEPHAQKNRYYRDYPKVAGSRAQRLNALRDKKTGLVLATGGMIGGAVAGKQQFGKAAGHLAAASLTGSGLIGYRAGQPSKDRDRQATAAAVGGWAGQGAYQGAGYGYRWKVRGIGGKKVPKLHRDGLNANRKNFPDPVERKQRDKLIKEKSRHRQAYDSPAARKRNTPKHFYGAKMERRLGWTHAGKTGMAIGTAATGLGGVAGIALTDRMANKKKAQMKRKVAKREYGYREREISPLRAAGTGVGLGLIAYGGSRNGMLARNLARGARMPGRNRTAYIRAEKARAAVEDFTGQGAKMLKEATGSGFRIRNSEAVAGGAAVTYYSQPVARNKFTPVAPRPNVQYGGY